MVRAGGQLSCSILRKALNFAQGGDNNESDNFLYLPIINHLLQANLLSRLLQQRRRWVGGDKVWGKEGTEGWDQVRGGLGRGERRRKRERCGAHTGCPLITPLSLIAQQSHVTSSSASIRRACRALWRLRPRSLRCWRAAARCSAHPLRTHAA
jgi:hypothetical protein